MLKSLASHVSLSIVLCSASLWIGYQLGARSHSDSRKAGRPTPSIADTPAQDEDDEGEGDIADGDLAAVKPGILESCKLVLVVRTDLHMTPGKIAAQCGHATLACYKALMKKNPKLVHHWERIGQAKIALKADSEEQLMELEAIAKSLNLCARSILDAGHTQVDPGTKTVLGIGPAPVELINQVTGKLRLF